MQLRETGLIGDVTNKNSSELGCASWMAGRRAGRRAGRKAGRKAVSGLTNVSVTINGQKIKCLLTFPVQSDKVQRHKPGRENFPRRLSQQSQVSQSCECSGLWACNSAAHAALLCPASEAARLPGKANLSAVTCVDSLDPGFVY